MPIRINLLAEAKAAEEFRRRDPVKRAVFLGTTLVVVFLGWAGIVAIFAMGARATLTSVQTAITAKTNAYDHVMLEHRRLVQTQDKLKALQKLQSARFLQGNLLNALQHATLEGVQLTQMRVDQSYVLLEAPGGHTNDDRVQENITLHLTAKDSSANPGDEVNPFQSVIAKQPYFEAMLSKTNGVELAGPPSPVQVGGGKPYVTFVVNCHFIEHIR